MTELETMFKELQEASARIELMLNRNKTKIITKKDIMKFGKENQTTHTFLVSMGSHR